MIVIKIIANKFNNVNDFATKMKMKIIITIKTRKYEIIIEILIIDNISVKTISIYFD